MSATNRGAKRQIDDWYQTPPAVVRAILPKIRLGPDALDPCAGRGAILRVLQEEGPEIPRPLILRGLEIHPERAEACRTLAPTITTDALGPTSWNRPTGIIMNPPYSLAMDFVLRALKEVTPTGMVAVLLRLQWLASAERARFHKKHPSHIFVLDRRPSFCAVWRCHPKDGGCGWTLTTEPNVTIAVCPQCQKKKLRVTRNDSADYAWFCWARSITKGRWSILRVPKAEKRLAA